MNLAAHVTDVVAAQTTLVRCQRVWRITDMVATGARRVELDVLDSTLPDDVGGDGLRGRGSTMIAQTDEQHADRLRHGVSIQAIGMKRRSRRLLLTTNTLDAAIAALATIGESSQAMASGMAATL